MKQANVLHIFGEYLPLTMSWAYLLLRQTPEVTTHVAGLALFDNEYRDASFHYWPNPRYRSAGRLFHRFFPVPFHLFLRKLRLYDRSLVRYCRRHHIEVLHAHFGNIGADYYPLRRKLNIPLIVSFYGYDYGRILQARPRYRSRYRKMFEQADAFICEGPYGGRSLADLGCPPEKIRIIHLGVDVNAIPFFEREKPAGSLRMVQVASFEERKGHLHAIEAFAQAAAECPRITLDLYGPYFDRKVTQQVKQKIREYGLQDQVRLRGPVDYSSLHEVLKHYDLIIQPSLHTARGDCEGGAPIILLDAQATGMPVLATRHCDIPSEVVDGRTGRLVAEGDTAGLAAQIRYFYELTPDAYRAYATAARKHVEDHYDLQDCAREVGRLYYQLLSRG